MKLAVFKDVEIDENGVSTYWYYECYHKACATKDPDYVDHFNYHSQNYLYWENALSGANKHVIEKHFPQKVES